MFRVTFSELKRWLARASLCGLTLSFLAVDVHSSPAPSDDRLVSLARLWAVVEFFHPSTTNPSFAWDGAVASALPGIQSATSAAEMAAALQPMLAVLRDPLTRVVTPETLNESWEPSGKGPDTTVLEDGILLVSAHDQTNFQGFNQLANAVAKASTVVFDFRKQRWLQQTFDYSLVARLLSSERLVAPGQRRHIYQGWDNQAGFLVDGGGMFDVTENANDKRVVFVFGSKTQPSNAALALQAKGNARIVVEGAADESATVERWTVQFPYGVLVQVRTSELLNANFTTGYHPDIVVKSGALDEALAIARAREWPRREVPMIGPAVSPARRPWMDVRFEPRAARVEVYPSEPERLIGAYRVWSVVQLFDPFRESGRAEWEGVLSEFIPIVLRSAGAEEYHLAIAAMMARAKDPHAVVRSPLLNATLFPTPNPPLAIDTVEGKAVVTRTLEGVAEIKPGDIVVAVNGEGIESRQQRYQQYDCCANGLSNPGLRGPEGSKVDLTVEGPDGRRRTVTLNRTRSNYRAYYPARAGKPVQILPWNIGYVDLEQLEESQLMPTLEQLRSTDGIIFDLRGGARFTAWPIAARLTSRATPPVLRRISRLVLSPSVLLPPRITDIFNDAERQPPVDVMQSSLAYLPATNLWRYEKPTIALINSWASSSPEISAMILKVGAGTKLVGSRTAGAFGIRMIFSVPGGITASYTGSGFQFPDGKDAQAVGLQPDIEVTPTISGVREGRDEVLERALREFRVTQRVRSVGTAP